MGFLDRFVPGRTALAQEAARLTDEIATTKVQAMEYVRESMMVALGLALEDRGWLRQDGFDRGEDNHLTLAAIQSAAVLGAALVQGNPIMERAALAKSGYVLGNGVRIDGADAFVDKPSNRESLFSEEAMVRLLFSKIHTGNVLILISGTSASLIPFYQIKGAVYDPYDSSKILYFFRRWQERVTDFENQTTVIVERKMLYPNLTYDRGGLAYPDTYHGVDVYQGGVIKHVAPNRLIGGAWGIPDLLAGIFYAGEHKELVEAADAIYRAQSQYAVQYKTKTRKALEQVAAQIAGPAPIDERTGQVLEYGQTVAFGDDIEMQLMTKIGAGIDFAHFDPIASLASSVLGVPLDVVLGKETATETSIPFNTLQIMKIEQRFWSDVFKDVLAQMGVKRKKVKVYWPKINPDPTHRQVQSIVGIAALKIVSPEEVRKLARDTFGADWQDAVPDPSEWDKFAVKTAAPGSTEPAGGTVTPGQGQTGQLGKLADGDHSLRDEGQQAHTA